MSHHGSLSDPSSMDGGITVPTPFFICNIVSFAVRPACAMYVGGDAGVRLRKGMSA
jgi:hypothetical protein